MVLCLEFLCEYYYFFFLFMDKKISCCDNKGYVVIL